MLDVSGPPRLITGVRHCPAVAANIPDQHHTMSLLSDFYIATPENAAHYDSDRKLPDSERAEFNGLTYEELANLWAILQNTPPTPQHSDAFESVLVIDGGQRLINRFPSAFVEMLASLDDSGATAAAQKWVQTGELAFMSCQPSDVLPILEAASRLAQNAMRAKKCMYLWMCV
jgi:hypothetical protein